MPKNIVELISSGQSIHAVKNVERTLANKLLQAISEHASEVARQAYGTLDEYFGGDEQPDYVNNSDNAYAVFFANALKKFGVNGPEDFKDEVTKQRFFDYVDHNWRAQDSVQTPIQGAQGGGMEQGTQTALPSPATPPMAPTAPSGGSPTTAQGNDPSLATMAPAGPSINKTAPLDQSGQDPTLNGVQNQQTYAGDPAGGDQYGGDPLATDEMGGEGGELDGSGSFGNMGGMNQGMGAGNGDMCPMCKGTGKAACPTCGRPHEMSGAPGMGGGLDQDPDLEIGPEDDGSGMGGDDEDGMQADGFGGDGQDELAGDTQGLEGGDEGGAFGDEGDQAGNGDGSVPGGDEQETDDPFDDEDAYTIDASDFNTGGGEDEDTDEEGADEFGEGGFEGQGDGGDEGDEGFGTGDPDADIDNEESEEGDEEDPDVATGAGQEADLQGDDQDPDLEIGDDDSADEDNGDDEQGFSGDDDDSDEDEGDEDDDEDSDEDQDDDSQDSNGSVPPKKTSFGESLKARSWSRKERKADSKKPNRQAAKKEIRMAEDFGFGLDDAEDDVFLAEALMMQQKAPAPDPGLGKLINYVQQQLSRIKKMRNTMLMQLRRERAVIKKDPAIDGQEKMDAMKQLAQMATDNRKFFKNQAKLVKAMFTGNLSGGGMGGDEEGGMDQDTDQDQDMQGGQDQDMGQDQEQGFPPQAGGDEEGGDEGDQDFGDDVEDQSGFAGGGDEGGDEEAEPSDDEEMSQGTAPSAPAGFPAKKKSPFPPKKDEGGDDDEDAGDDDSGGDDEDAPPAKPAKKPFPPVKEEVLKEYGNTAALESKIKMLAMQIATKGDPGGKRRSALNSLEHQLKARR